MSLQSWLWVGFGIFVLSMLALDLGVFHRSTHAVSFKDALGWTAAWVTLALGFGAGVWYFLGPQKGAEFFTAWLIEYSLSADNVFIFALIFSYFAVPSEWQHKVLFWGILGALLMRLAMIGLGVALINHFAWILYLFGAFLLITGFKMVFGKDEEVHPERNPVVRAFTRFVPVTQDYMQNKFAVRVQGRWMATPLLVVLVCVEVSDLVFAVDSIPAVFAISLDTFIVYTSNVFAILGLRSLYFVLAGVMHKFCYLRLGLGSILSFVGVKMLLAHSPLKVGAFVSLGVIVSILCASVIASLVWPRKRGEASIH
ncbi:MAG: TerC family protein [Opitutaceae bacterium]|jgi:tellurite resistance protein TerC